MESRCIKFRAWDKEKKLMIYPDTESKEWDYFQLTLKGEICLYDTDDYGKTGLWEHDISFKDDRFILMQFTGLKDKNGTEIYEGDIAQHLRYGDKRWQIGLVIWAEELAAWIVKHWYNKAKSDKFWSTRFEEILIDEIEVIGNIHQNPELMEQENE